jgi:YegS/Rv2252/BmrU family lipid kinase
VDPLLLITNAEAGGGSDEEQIDLALDVLRAGTDIEVCATRSRGELDGVLHRRGDRRVVVLGGDGSLHAVVAALHRRHELHKVVLGLIPRGTGNDFARGNDIPLDPAEAARLVLEGEVRPVDLIIDNVDEVVVNNVHVGLGAEASRKAHKWKKPLGRIGYYVGAAMASVNPPFVRVRVVVDDHVVADLDRPILQVSIGNGSNVGGGTELTPEADTEDGRLDLMVSYAIGPFSRFGYAFHLNRGEHHERDDVLYLRGSTVSVSGQGFYCSADGELYGPERNRTWRIEKAAYSMILPA